MIFEPLFVTEKTRLPDGAVAADRVHSVSVEETVRGPAPAVPLAAGEAGALSVHPASAAQVARATTACAVARRGRPARRAEMERVELVVRVMQ